MNFDSLDEFEKDLKKLSKRRFKSLFEDLDTIKKLLRENPTEKPPLSFRITGLRISTSIIKLKKFACKSVKSKGTNSGMRLIYTFDKQENTITFIELYHKGDKSTEDKSRIYKYFS